MTKREVIPQNNLSFLFCRGYNQADMLNDFYIKLQALPLKTLLWIVWGSFGGIALFVFILAIGLPNVRRAPRAPFLCLVNIYAALTFAAFYIFCPISESIFAAAIFWAAGYLLYGLLAFICRPRKRAQPVRRVRERDAALSAVRPKPQKTEKPVAPQGNIRLDHAIAVTDRLLGRELGKTDRLELEKLRNTLAVLKVKGVLSPAEGEILNENFNTLLKLMAKYNI